MSSAGSQARLLALQGRLAPSSSGSVASRGSRSLTFFTLALRHVTQHKLAKGEARTGTFRLATYALVLAKGRTEIVLNAFGGHGTVTRSSVARLARILVERIQT